MNDKNKDIQQIWYYFLDRWRCIGSGRFQYLKEFCGGLATMLKCIICFDPTTYNSSSGTGKYTAEKIRYLTKTYATDSRGGFKVFQKVRILPGNTSDLSSCSLLTVILPISTRSFHVFCDANTR